jgi:outer membrane protein assembly factor BamB
VKITPQMILPTGLVAGALTLFWAVAAQADDWPQWRGPQRDGTWSEAGVLETLPREGLKVRWRASVGPGWSSPSVAQGRVFVTDSLLNRPKAKERILCFDEHTGKPLWTYAYEVSYPDWAFSPTQEAGPSATPLIEAGKVYSLGGNGHVLCLNTDKGELLWEQRLDKQYVIEPLVCRASPLIDGNLLILHAGAKPGACVIALDKTTGKEVWKALAESVTNSSPIIITAGGKRQLIVWTTEAVTSLDPATGKPWWRERLLTSNDDAVATSVFQENRLLISGLMLQLKPDKPAASILWPDRRTASERVLSNTSTPILQGGYVFSARSSGHLVCLDASTGTEVWQTDKVTGVRRGASIHITPQGKGMFLYTDQGELIRAMLTPQGYQEVGRSSLIEPVYPFAGRKVAWSPPAFANRHVFVRNERELVSTSLAAKP